VVLQGERQGLKHAFYEVLLNAIQASPKKGVVSAKSILRSDDRGQKWVDVEIRDAGAGFAPQAVVHAGEPFFTTKVVGLGLGLAVCRKIVEGHKGRLEITPPTPQGAGVVRISLPLNYRPDPAPLD
jgi:two-component system sporulation sensor kinase A